MTYPWLTLIGLALAGLIIIAAAWRATANRPGPNLPPPKPRSQNASSQDENFTENSRRIAARLPDIRITKSRSERIFVQDADLFVLDSPVINERLALPFLLQAQASRRPVIAIAPSWDEVAANTLAANFNHGLTVLPLIGEPTLAADLCAEITTGADLRSGYLPRPLAVSELAANSADSLITLHDESVPEQLDQA